jgi:hypothetical protein
MRGSATSLDEGAVMRVEEGDLLEDRAALGLAVDGLELIDRPQDRHRASLNAFGADEGRPAACHIPFRAAARVLSSPS